YQNYAPENIPHSARFLTIQPGFATDPFFTMRPFLLCAHFLYYPGGKIKKSLQVNSLAGFCF
ncbi:MAG: hypothetical protein K2G07_02590, partial [Muribaculaceae bacterium]|nr:hypothetical protein [Muribaculaceae bacterium]